MSVPGGGSHSPVAAVPGTATAAAADKIIIIGGGIAGLACGCYLQMNGFQTEILEAGLLPGGLCHRSNTTPIPAFCKSVASRFSTQRSCSGTPQA